MHALRIFRLLLLKKQLEQKQIADLSMLDLKETRTVLYRMMKAGYVQMQVGNERLGWAISHTVCNCRTFRRRQTMPHRGHFSHGVSVCMMRRRSSRKTCTKQHSIHTVD